MNIKIHPDGWSIFNVINHGVKECHIVPNNDFIEHQTDALCDCCPTEDDEQCELWIHHSMDKRELYEKGRKLT